MCVRKMDRFRHLLVILLCHKHSENAHICLTIAQCNVLTLNQAFEVVRKRPHNAGIELKFVHTTTERHARLCTPFITKEEVLSVWGPEGEEKDE